MAKTPEQLLETMKDLNESPCNTLLHQQWFLLTLAGVVSDLIHLHMANEPDEEHVEENPTGQFRARMNDDLGFGTGTTVYGVQTADRFTLVLQDGSTPVKLGRIEDYAQPVEWLD